MPEIASISGVIKGDIVGRDKIGLDEGQLVSFLEARGVVLAAETAGLQRRVVIALAQRLRPTEPLDYEQAVTELERAVEIALEVISGERGEQAKARLLERAKAEFNAGNLDRANDLLREGDAAQVVEPVLRIFLCHASEDKEAVRALNQKLRQPGFDPWLDEEKLLPGQNWDAEITKAIRASDVFLVCLSQRSEKRGYVQKEIARALDVAEEQPEGRIFLIPALLEDCHVPERLRGVQWVNLFHDNGFGRLQASLRALQDSLRPTHKS